MSVVVVVAVVSVAGVAKPSLAHALLCRTENEINAESTYSLGHRPSQLCNRVLRVGLQGSGHSTCIKIASGAEVRGKILGSLWSWKLVEGRTKLSDEDHFQGAFYRSYQINFVEEYTRRFVEEVVTAND